MNEREELERNWREGLKKLGEGGMPHQLEKGLMCGKAWRHLHTDGSRRKPRIETEKTATRQWLVGVVIAIVLFLAGIVVTIFL